MLEASAFNGSFEGKEINLFTISQEGGASVQITNYGARLVAIWVPDKNGTFGDVCVGLATASDYINAKALYYGAAIGPYANRIGKGQFCINEDTILIGNSNGQTVLHSGDDGFHSQIWDARQISEQKIVLSYLSKELECGFPGNLSVEITYELTKDNELRIDYRASTDKRTLVNLTNHAFFNLGGEGSGPITDQFLQINANQILSFNQAGLPSGEYLKVKGTPFDFTKRKRIGDDIEVNHPQLAITNGFDHNWVINDYTGELKHAAVLMDPESGRVMDVFTTEPGIQFYTSNFLKGLDIGKHGKPINKRESLCLETQHFPDSPNHPKFPSTILEPGQEFSSTTIYKFSVK